MIGALRGAVWFPTLRVAAAASLALVIAAALLAGCTLRRDVNLDRAPHSAGSETATIAALAPGDWIEVVLVDAETLQGRYVSVSEDSLRLIVPAGTARHVEGVERAVALARIRSLSREELKRPSHAGEAMLAAGVFLAIVLAVIVISGAGEPIVYGGN